MPVENTSCHLLTMRETVLTRGKKCFFGLIPSWSSIVSVIVVPSISGGHKIRKWHLWLSESKVEEGGPFQQWWGLCDAPEVVHLQFAAFLTTNYSGYSWRERHSNIWGLCTPQPKSQSQVALTKKTKPTTEKFFIFGVGVRSASFFRTSIWKRGTQGTIWK